MIGNKENKGIKNNEESEKISKFRKLVRNTSEFVMKNNTAIMGTTGVANLAISAANFHNEQYLAAAISATLGGYLIGCAQFNFLVNKKNEMINEISKKVDIAESIIMNIISNEAKLIITQQHEVKKPDNEREI